MGALGGRASDVEAGVCCGDAKWAFAGGAGGIEDLAPVAQASSEGGRYQPPAGWVSSSGEGSDKRRLDSACLSWEQAQQVKPGRLWGAKD